MKYQRGTWLVAAFVVGAGIVALGAARLPAQTVGTAPSDEECQQFALQLERSINQRVPVMFSAAFNTTALYDKALKGVPLTAEQRKSFLEGADKETPFGLMICRSLGNGGAYTFLRIKNDRGRKVLLFRLITPAGVNFHELEVAKSDAGKVEILDIYIYLAGERFSDIQRRSAQSAATDAKGVAAGKDEFAQNFTKIHAVRQLQIEGKPAEAWAAWKALPAGARKHRTVLLMGITLARNAGEKEYGEVLEFANQTTAGDVTYDFPLIDAAVMGKRYDEALERIGRIEKLTGPEAYLAFLKGRMHLLKEDYDSATRFARESIAQEQWLREPYFLLIDITIAQKDHARTAKLLDFVEEKIGWQFPPEALEQNDSFAEFVKSADYRTWSTPRKAKPTEALPKAAPAEPKTPPKPAPPKPNAKGK